MMTVVVVKIVMTVVTLVVVKRVMIVVTVMVVKIVMIVVTVVVVNIVVNDDSGCSEESDDCDDSGGTEYSGN
jgi:hypothetical protein